MKFLTNIVILGLVGSCAVMDVWSMKRKFDDDGLNILKNSAKKDLGGGITVEEIDTGCFKQIATSDGFIVEQNGLRFTGPSNGSVNFNGGKLYIDGRLVWDFECDTLREKTEEEKQQQEKVKKQKTEERSYRSQFDDVLFEAKKIEKNVEDEESLGMLQKQVKSLLEIFGDQKIDGASVCVNTNITHDLESGDCICALAATIKGDVKASKDILLVNCTIEGDIDSSSGKVTLINSSVKGKVHAQNNIVILNDKEMCITDEIVSSYGDVCLAGVRVENNVKAQNDIRVTCSFVTETITSSYGAVSIRGRSFIKDIKAQNNIRVTCSFVTGTITSSYGAIHIKAASRVQGKIQAQNDIHIAKESTCTGGFKSSYGEVFFE